ncbi:phosphotransferase family protein [Cryptosporangium aurantiacum]|uniref:Predicted kinase, aminoglycoside phosphotransferase (APT) family n=1 Tax=Cryptosporangium aurantiacum TaxID=134849 RepID=A0A1M7RK20_9ACTN|nr:aminoglycoside phosphotransferase family protein [Cryptosporangium aurantiacum]SHN46490.1 Predicted kinase, aminoglycoside phosphotransferase (APT) family [Cryptosporangium aurantiacum]
MNPSLALRCAATLGREVARCGASRVVRGRLPDRGSRVTTGWLEAALGLPSGALRSIDLVSEDSGTAARARFALDVRPGHDAPSHVFLKLTPHNFAQHVMMNVVGLGTREALFYRAVAPHVPIRVPGCHAVRVDPALGRIALVLEDLSGRATFRDVRDDVSLREAEAVVDAFADLHAALWESPRLSGELAPLGPLRLRSPVVGYLGGAVVRRGLAKPAASVTDLIPADVVRRSRVLYENLPAVDAYWAAQPQTLTHGDPHLGNLFFEGPTPGFLDWQVATIGPGVRDVVYFVVTAMRVPEARKHERDLVERYAARLGAAGVAANPETLWTSYRALAAEAYIAAVATAGAGERMQSREVARSGVQRAAAAVEALDTFEVLADLVGLERSTS